jgi:hypothetical protein
MPGDDEGGAGRMGQLMRQRMTNYVLEGGSREGITGRLHG